MFMLTMRMFMPVVMGLMPVVVVLMIVLKQLVMHVMVSLLKLFDTYLCLGKLVIRQQLLHDHFLQCIFAHIAHEILILIQPL